jgi:hypothetical protein
MSVCSSGGDRGKAECGASAEGWRECSALRCFFVEHIRRGRISLLTDAAVPSPPAPSGVRQAPRVSAGLLLLERRGTPIQGKRSAPPPEPRSTDTHFLKCFGTCPGVAPLLLGPFYCECRQVRAAGRIPPRDTQQHSVLGYWSAGDRRRCHGVPALSGS